MKLLAFSDLHRDLAQAERLVAASEGANVVVGAGDFASQHAGLEEAIAALRPIERPTVLIPGNNETDDALRAACEGWDAATVLHGEGAEIDGIPFWGLGAGVPITPWDWSFDLDEDAAAAMLSDCPTGAVLVVHSPPRGHVDRMASGQEMGSTAIRDAIEAREPRLAVCGHIHDSWGERSRIGPTEIANLGPAGAEFDI
jgi:Icc-related predicted phosphoesterase